MNTRRLLRLRSGEKLELFIEGRRKEWRREGQLDLG